MANEYRPFAYDVSANVENPATWLADTVRLGGFVAGVANPAQANTALRQTTVAVSAIAQAVADTLVVNVLDDGSVTNFKNQFIALLDAVALAAINTAGSFGSGGIFGMITSNTPSFTTTRISISAGQCRNSLNNANIVLAAPISKRLDAVWAAGTTNGGRDTAGALTNGATWHVFVIFNPTTLAVDGLFSQSPTAPTLPTGFTKFRRIGSIILEIASTLIRQYLQTGDWFMLSIRSADFANQANNGAASLRQLVGVPIGIKVEAQFYFQSNGTIDANPYLSGIFDPDFGVPPAFGGTTQWAQIRRLSVGGTYAYGTVVCRQFTDTTGKVYTFSNDGADVIALGVLGWRDERGRFF